MLPYSKRIEYAQPTVKVLLDALPRSMKEGTDRFRESQPIH